MKLEDVETLADLAESVLSLMPPTQNYVVVDEWFQVAANIVQCAYNDGHQPSFRVCAAEGEDRDGTFLKGFTVRVRFAPNDEIGLFLIGDETQITDYRMMGPSTEYINTLH